MKYKLTAKKIITSYLEIEFDIPEDEDPDDVINSIEGIEGGELNKVKDILKNYNSKKSSIKKIEPDSGYIEALSIEEIEEI